MFSQDDQCALYKANSLRKEKDFSDVTTHITARIYVSPSHISLFTYQSALALSRVQLINLGNISYIVFYRYKVTYCSY